MKVLKTKNLIVSLILLGLAFYLFIIFPYFSVLVKYYSLSGSGLVYSLKGRTSPENESLIVEPASTTFGLLISKLGFNKRIIKSVDFYDEVKLKTALGHGLAHVENSSLPGDHGAILVVGHPLYSLFNFSHFNPDFYLIGKLEPGDEISLFYDSSEFIYRVKTKKSVGPTYLDFFEPGEEKKLVLVAGSPPGMAFKFLVVEAEEIH